MGTQEHSSDRLYWEDSKRQAHANRVLQLKKGNIVTAERFCDMLGIKPEDLELRVKDFRVIKLELDGEFYYPKFYGKRGINCSELEQVAEILAPIDAWGRWVFFMQRKLTLNGKTPLQALSQNKFEKVLDAARGYVEL